MSLLTDYRPFVDGTPRDAVGWDAWAEDYARLPRENSTYALGKQILYEALEPRLPSPLRGSHRIDVLDFNCGCGNDFPFFLHHGYRVTGCDQSSGMLSVAAHNFSKAVEAGDVVLYGGSAEHLSPGSFDGARFDVIFAGTGSLAYLADDELHRVHESFAALLRPGGVLLVTHLQPHCLAESCYHLLRGRPRRAFQRWRDSVEVSIRDQTQTMYLRSPKALRNLLGDTTPPDALVPLGVLVPPFQSGFHVPQFASRRLQKAEVRALSWSLATHVCDQVLYVYSQP